MVKIPGDLKPKYQLISIDQNIENGSITATPYFIHLKDIISLQDLMNKSKPFNFSPEINKLSVIYGGPKRAFLKRQHIDMLVNLSSSFKDKDKNIYPFLSNMTITSDEASRCLRNSSLKFLVDAISSCSLERRVTVKGYPKSVHADISRRKLVVTRTHAYCSDYKKLGFFRNTDSINSKKVRKKYLNNKSAMKTGNLEGDTMVRSIKVVI